MNDQLEQRLAEMVTKFDERALLRLEMIGGMLGLPPVAEYSSIDHFLCDVYSRICEAKSVAMQAAKILGAAQ